MSMTAHTPTPWTIKTARDGSGDVGITADGLNNVLAETFADLRFAGEHNTAESEANAALIVTAVNALEPMKEALRDMLSGWKYIRQHHGDLYGVGWDRAQKKAEAALRLVEGGETA